MSDEPDYRVSADAQSDLNSILDYVQDKMGDVAAAEADDYLHETFERLARLQLMGKPRPLLTDADAFFLVVPNVHTQVIYQPGDPLLIVRLWDTRRNPEKLRGAISAGLE